MALTIDLFDQLGIDTDLYSYAYDSIDVVSTSFTMYGHMAWYIDMVQTYKVFGTRIERTFTIAKFEKKVEAEKVYFELMMNL